MKKYVPLLVAVLSMSALYGLFPQAGDDDRLYEVVRQRFGESEWTNVFSSEMAMLAREGKVPDDAIEFVLAECGDETKSMNAEDAAFALFTFAYDYDMSLKRGAYPVSLKYEIRSLMRSGVSDGEGFKWRFRERMHQSLDMMEMMQSRHIANKMNRFFGKSNHGPAKKAGPKI